MLEVDNLNARYGKSHVLRGVNLQVRAGEAVGLLGRNGVGKTTTLRSIMRLLASSEGSIVFDGQRVDQLAAHKIPSLGLGLVPQGRRLFPKLTVAENLCIGLAREPEPALLADVFGRFPRLAERGSQLAGTLSGGEQQQLAIARCLVMRPKMILFDEPTEGVMPKLVTAFRKQIAEIHHNGISILLVEQNIKTALALCDRIYIMEKGVICYEGTSASLKQNPEIIHRHLGVSL